MKRTIIIFLSVFFVTFNVIGQGVVYVDNSETDGVYDLSGNVFYLIDTADQFTFEQILQGDLDAAFKQAKNPVFKFKKDAPSQWYKLKISNNTNSTQPLVLSINNPLINDITFYNSIDSAYYHTGFLHPFTQRQVYFNNYLFNININPGDDGLICFKVKKQHWSMHMPITLMTENAILDKLRVNAFFEGIFYCLVLVFLTLILILYQSEKEKSYLFLFLVLFILGLVNIWRDGFLFQFIWPNSFALNYISGKILYSLLVFSVILYIHNQFKVKKLSKVLAKISQGAMAISIVFAVSLVFVRSSIYFYYGYRLLLLLLLIVSLWAMHTSRKQKIQFHAYYSMAVGFLVADLLLLAFFVSSSTGIGFYDIQITSLATVIFFLIIGYVFITKFKRSRLEVIGLNKNLEQLVEKRTEQLNSQKEELKSQHEELIQQKETLQTQREELRAKKELLEVSNAELTKLSLVASKTDNLIYIFLPDGQLDWFNASFANKIGISIEDYQRTQTLNIIDVSNNKNIKHVLNTCLREKVVVSFESKVVDDNSNEKWYQTTLTPILDDKENVNYLIAIDTDITQLKQFEGELEDQSKDAELQKNLAIKRKEELEERQIEITDSIRYAKRIQTGIMPKVKQIQRDFPDSFVLFLPKDIVSGDFYWYHRVKDKYFIAAVDCTGHGVPGAFMSIIGTYLLNSIIINNGVEDPAEILKQLNRKLKIALKADSRSQTSDGMDLTVAIIDKNEKWVEFASALRPVYLFNNGDFVEIKGDKIPITSSISGTTISTFTKHKYPFNEGDMFYLFSDGVIDQFGGKHGKKFLSKRFKQLLYEINPLAMREQKDIIKKAIDDWRGEIEQVDDILVMGVRYKDI